MIANISDRKDTSFLSIDKALSNKIKFSLLKNGISLNFEQHFHEIFVVSIFWSVITLFVVQRISAMQCFSTYLTFFLYKYKYIYYLCKISICYHKRNCFKYNKDT